MPRLPFHLLLPVALLTGCAGQDGSTLDIAFIDNAEAFFAAKPPLSSGARHLRAATGSGLVAFDVNGEVVPALADRWIVTDDGRSFIFRLRDAPWADGTEMTAESVRAALLRTLRRAQGTDLGLDLAAIDEVRAMAGRVIEIRLAAPVPAFLQLLAQPELVLAETAQSDGVGPMHLARINDSAELSMKRPADRGLPEAEDWREDVRALRISPVSAEQALTLFDEGRVDLVLGGGIGWLPRTDSGPLSRGTVRIDGTIGLFGLLVRNGQGFLSEPDRREAISMAIDRAALIEPFNVTGWSPGTRVVPAGLPGDSDAGVARWGDLSLEMRREEAGNRVGAWLAASANDADAGEENDPALPAPASPDPAAASEPAPALVTLTIALGSEPGHALLLRQLKAQLAPVGVTLVRAAEPADADLVLIDEVARYAGPRWFLNQFNCALKRGLCSSEADLMVELANHSIDLSARETLLSEAQAQLEAQDVFIPFGAPLRWSLVRGTVTGFAPNIWALHTLPALATIPR